MLNESRTGTERPGGVAKFVCVVSQCDQERLVPLPEAFGAVFGFWLKDRNRTEMVFAKADGKPLAPQGGRVPRIQEATR